MIFKIFRAVFPWSGQLMRPCCMVNIPPKVICKYTRLLPVAVFQQVLSIFFKKLILCFFKGYIYFICHIYCLSLLYYFCRWSYGVLLYEIFTIGNIEWKFMRICLFVLFAVVVVVFFYCIFTRYRFQLDKLNELPHATLNSIKWLRWCFSGGHCFVTFIFRWSCGSSRRFTLPTNGWKKNCKLTSGWIQDA